MKACCFTGHRDIPEAEKERIMEKARAEILRLTGEGVEEFRVGGAVGFDMIMAELLLELREKEEKPIRILSVIPYPSWRTKWNEADRKRQDRILRESNQVVYVRQHYCRGIYMIRNRALADGADYCIAYCTRPSGGTAWTVRYAKQKGIPVYNTATEMRARMI